MVQFWYASGAVPPQIVLINSQEMSLAVTILSTDTALGVAKTQLVSRMQHVHFTGMTITSCL